MSAQSFLQIMVISSRRSTYDIATRLRRDSGRAMTGLGSESSYFFNASPGRELLGVELAGAIERLGCLVGVPCTLTRAGQAEPGIASIRGKLRQSAKKAFRIGKLSSTQAKIGSQHLNPRITWTQIGSLAGTDERVVEAPHSGKTTARVRCVTPSCGARSTA